MIQNVNISFSGAVISYSGKERSFSAKKQNIENVVAGKYNSVNSLQICICLTKHLVSPFNCLTYSLICRHYTDTTQRVKL